MATPIGHMIVGGAIGASFSAGGNVRTRVSAGALASLAADLDFIPGGLLGDPALFHHAESHSLVFTGLAFLVGWLLGSQARFKWGLLIASAYASHLLLDFFTLDLSEPKGIPLLWPVSPEVFQSSVALLPNVQHTLNPVISLHNVGLVGLEIVMFGPLLLWAVLADHRKRGLKVASSIKSVIKRWRHRRE